MLIYFSVIYYILTNRIHINPIHNTLMTPLESTLIVIIILLVLYVVFGKKSGGLTKGQTLNCKSNDGQTLKLVVSNGSAASDTPSYDDAAKEAMQGNMEYFQVCGGYSPEQVKATCDDSSGVYTHDYGNEGMDYKSYAASQAVDTQVVRNHAEFIKNIRGLGPNGEFTGRTYSPDSHDSYDPIPWIGLRRPEYVKTCNPTSVPDVDYNLYKGNRKFCLIT